MSKFAVGLMAALIASTSLAGVVSAEDRVRQARAVPCPAARR